MDWLPESLIIIGMFLVRLGVPIAITLAVAYFLRRLDARWQAEAWVEWEASQPEEKVSAKARPFLTSEPCWALKGCDETTRANCAATKEPGLPCWLARRRSEGKLPAECYKCELFSLRQIA